MRIKNSSVEVLFSEILIDDDGVIIRPSECPGSGRVEDLVYDEEKQPCCIFKDSPCPYFDKVYVTSSLRNKTILCNVISIEK